MTRLLLAGAVLALGLVSSPLATAAFGPDAAPDVSVREEGGTYEVRATFAIAQSADVARSVLSDYEQIPRFMPGIKSSVVRRRTPRLLVEQEAVSKFAMFSKTVHLLLEITEGDSYLHFVDLCGRSFIRYEGLWRIEPQGAGAEMSYELSARPAFDVPGFVIKRLLKRNASEMIERLKAEIAAR
ncbi:MAG: SRPBCC family protein [Vicinamibacterales bacterium]